MVSDTFRRNEVGRRREGSTRRRTPSLAVQIRRARHRDGYSVAKIARQLSLSPFVVREVLRGRELPGKKVGRVDDE
jgi:ribosome-binding protein aMBF1 (putative translation factor)